MSARRHVPFGCVAVVAGAGLVVEASPVWADPLASSSTDAAAEAFREGRRDAEGGAYAAAARAFARADAIAPNEVALDAALKAAVLADDAPLGMELVERSNRSESAKTLPSAGDARARFASRVGRLRVACDQCKATLDGAPYAANVAAWVGIGSHQVDLVEGGRAVRLPISVTAGAEAIARMPPITVPVLRSAPGKDAKSESFHGISPAFFFVGLGLTLASGGGLIASAVDVQKKHDAFQDTQSAELQAEGEAATLRTNVLIGVTGGLGLATVVLAILTDWKSLSPVAKPGAARRAAAGCAPRGGESTARFDVALDESGVAVALSGAF